MERRIREFQEEYYKEIAAYHSAGSSNAFIEFMLDKSNFTLDRALNQAQAEDDYLPEQVRHLPSAMEYDVSYTVAQS